MRDKYMKAVLTVSGDTDPGVVGMLLINRSVAKIIKSLSSTIGGMK